MNNSKYNTHFSNSICFLSLVCLVLNAGILSVIFSFIEAQKIEEIKIVFNAHDPGNNKFYVPPTLSIPQYTSVRWTNEDSSFHTVTSGNYDIGPTNIFDSRLMVTGNTFLRTFDEKGQFPYYCTLHPFMTGTISVY